MAKLQDAGSTTTTQIDPTAGVGDVVNTETGDIEAPAVTAPVVKPKRQRKQKVPGTYPVTVPYVFTEADGVMLKACAAARSTTEKKITVHEVIGSMLAWAIEQYRPTLQPEADAYLKAHPEGVKATRAPKKPVNEMTAEEIEEFVRKQNAKAEELKRAAADASVMLDKLRAMRANQ